MILVVLRVHDLSAHLTNNDSKFYCAAFASASGCAVCLTKLFGKLEGFSGIALEVIQQNILVATLVVFHGLPVKALAAAVAPIMPAIIVSQTPNMVMIAYCMHGATPFKSQKKQSRKCSKDR
jgi:hypothetical protein